MKSKLENRIFHCGEHALTPIKQTVPYKIKSGCEARFIPITAEKGLKCFYTKFEARRSFNRQRKAYGYGLAPKVLSKDISKFGLTYDNEILKQWGYITETVKTFTPKAFDRYDPLLIKMYDLQQALKKSRVCGYDLHSGNVGVIRGKLVCIDFGDESSCP